MFNCRATTMRKRMKMMTTRMPGSISPSPLRVRPRSTSSSWNAVKRCNRFVKPTTGSSLMRSLHVQFFMTGQRATCPADHRSQGPRAKVGPHAEVPDEAAGLAQGQLPQRAHHHAARGGRRLHPDRAAAQAQGRLRRRRRPRTPEAGQEAQEGEGGLYCKNSDQTML